MTRPPTEKLRNLQQFLRSQKKVMIAFSGGVDSTFLLKAATDMLGHENVTGVTGISPSLPASEKEECAKLAKLIGAQHIFIETDELSDKNYVANNNDRCFYCKNRLFELLRPIAEEHGIDCICDGANADDENDFRPGSEAADKWDVASPLKEAGLTKDEIRLMSKNLGLPTFNKPAMACLSSRIPYGTEVTAERLSQIEQAEKVLHSFGFAQVRVRHHDEIARIEFSTEDLEKAMEPDMRNRVVEAVKNTGFRFVTLDMEGYRTGSFNDATMKESATIL